METNSKKRLQVTKTVHNQEPNYHRSLLEISTDQRERLLRRMSFLYGEEEAEAQMPELERILKVYTAHKPLEMLERERDFDREERFNERDIILITYGDLLRGEERSPLATLAKFCDSYLDGSINTLHILPFFPYSSDRGFSIIDFETVDPHLGSWQDIEDLENRYQLMFDGVINHISSKSRWFQEFLDGNPLYRDFFIAYAGDGGPTPDQRRLIFRPRTTSVLTEYQTIDGPVRVWTTFSDDQIDLNYKNPKVLLRVIEILLLYVRHGADIIRLDAVSYLWAEPGTHCIHLDQTHEIVKLFRDVLNIVAPGVALITETNVPHEENVSYFGNGHDEAQMVYNFALPPLVLHTFYRGDATSLSEWAKSLKYISNTTTFFNFLDSHDGIGLMGAKNILSQNDIDYLVERAMEQGGRISYKASPEGNEEPYEINITWYSALNREDDPDEDIAFQVKRFVASRIIALVLRGVPGIYLHSLIGTPNDIEAVIATKSNRAINRNFIDCKAIKNALKDPLSKISRINREFGRLIAIRTQQRAFHPNGNQHVLSLSPCVFAVLRVSPEGDQTLLTLTNVTSRTCQVTVPLTALPTDALHWRDLVGGMEWVAEGGVLNVSMSAYDVIWLEPLIPTEAG
jgi:sucrose phosphorylase